MFLTNLGKINIGKVFRRKDKMQLIKKISDFFKKLGEDHIGEYTAQCAYYTFLSFIPFVILLLSLIKYVNIEKDSLANILEVILPNILKSSVLDIIQEVYSKSIETISISAIFTLWSASKSFYALNKGLSGISNKQEENAIFLMVKGVLGAVISLFLVILVLVLLVFGGALETSIRNNFQEFSGIANILLAARSIISIFIMFFIFLLMYRFSPRKKGTTIKNCIPGASFTAIALYVISFFFSIYVDIFTNFSVIYGSLATLIVIMMWLYSIIYAIFLGAELNLLTEQRINYWFAKLKKT